jgi:lipoyl synthase
LPSAFPSHLRKKTIFTGHNHNVDRLLSSLNLSTVCQSARCPNRNECFGYGTATFLILGDICTRKCVFCAINKGTPVNIDPDEPRKIADAVNILKLKHVVITSVTRDDLPDGGADQFKKCVHAIRSKCPDSSIELLIPDFNADKSSLEKVISANPEVLNHNIETVPRLYPEIRPGADYEGSLRIIRYSKENCEVGASKSGLMLGLGETHEEILQTMRDLRENKCDILTLGQYLSPGKKYYPVKEYISPEKFQEYKQIGMEMGFYYIASGAFVRSSYQALEAWEETKRKKQIK